MDPIASNASAPLTADQRNALQKLHETAQQMESLFVDMLFKEMRKGAPASSLTGKTSNAEQTFGEMLDSKRAEALSKSGALGIGTIVEQQLRSAVVGDAGASAVTARTSAALPPPPPLVEKKTGPQP